MELTMISGGHAMIRRALALLTTVLALGVSTGCATTPCDDLDDAAAERGCANHDQDAQALECEGEAETEARCWLENVRDVCAPTTSELLAVSDCRGD